ncbi:heme ABC transporter ATP-binding protein [[Bacillus] enclensis]|jgi:iron complex transport system ATP-binding protein|uniref:heme ABC transporter ATP-binding protein n=1 Tax=[Bacillus] enclensis TaxID=1402860 RepID=UPI0018DC38AC|nr:heme ABC transporter ATP-binding protein [[Bacillus] enclensis]MBH9964748.1 heme ABC transporter ATP-binding protein [[Bacillus] enclensis]
MLEVDQISVGYEDASVVENIDFHVGKGEFFGILGPNGSGKTTLLKALSGILPPTAGAIQLNGKPLNEYSSKELAKLVAVLPQITSHSFSYRVKETVMLGRYPHQNGLFKSVSHLDEEIVQQALRQTGVEALQDRRLDELSGGEKQRVYLAQALAQEPKVILLDEPTNHLDLSYQKNLLELLKKQTKDQGLTVISIFHDLNLASLYCDRLIMLNKGETKIVDHPEEVLKEEHIREVYATEVHKQAHPQVAKPQIVILPEDNPAAEAAQPGEAFLHVTPQMITYRSPVHMKCMSSGVTGSGFGWYKNVVNRYVSPHYDCTDYREDMMNFLVENDLDPSFTVGMMTAVNLEDVAYDSYLMKGHSIFVVVTAGVGNAVDVTAAHEYPQKLRPGTVNTWVFVNGRLSDEAFIEALVVSTEAKVKAMQEQNVVDHRTGTLATGTPTDSILIASTHQGRSYPFAGSVTPLGQLIGKGVFETTKKAIESYRKRSRKS